MKIGQLGISTMTASLLFILAISSAAVMITSFPTASARYPGPDYQLKTFNSPYVYVDALAEGIYSGDYNWYYTGYWGYTEQFASPFYRFDAAQVHWYTNVYDMGWYQYDAAQYSKFAAGINSNTVYAQTKQDVGLSGFGFFATYTTDVASVTASP